MLLIETSLIETLPIETAGTALDAGEYDDVVVVRDLRVRSRCPCHGLPVDASVHVGYLPAGRLVAAGDLADALLALGRDEWVQPDAAARIADWVGAVTGARGVGVVVEGRFTCAGDERGARAPLLTTTTRGALRDDAARRNEFLAALRRVRPRARR